MDYYFVIRAIWGALVVLGAFGFIIFIHELGHFVIARRVGIRCPSFALGFGKSLRSYRWRGTEFSIRILPFGGYVQMIGEEPETEGELTWRQNLERCLKGMKFPATPAEMLNFLEERKADFDTDEERASYEEVYEHVRYLRNKVYGSLDEVEGNFNRCSVPARMAVILGGVTMNFISALLIIWFIGGVWGLGVITRDAAPRVAQALKGTPAGAAGLSEGDLVLEIQGVKITSGSQMVKEIARYPGEEISLTFKRPSGSVRRVKIIPDLVIGDYVFTRGRNGEPMVSPVSRGKKLKSGVVVRAVEGVKVSTLADMSQLVRDLSTERDRKRLKGGSNLEIATDVGKVSVPFSVDPVGRIGVALGSVTVIRMVRDVVGTVEPGSAAAEAGLRAGDLIESVNERPIVTGSDVAKLFGSIRDSKIYLVTFSYLGKRLIVLPEGIHSMKEAGFTMRRAGLYDAVVHGIRCVGYMIVAPVLVVRAMLSHIVPVKVVVKSSAGPLGIMHMLYALSDNGWAQFLFFAAMINAAVGAFNLIPFPALDGARFLFLLLGWIRRKEFDPKKEANLHYIGLAVLLLVVLLVTFMDVKRMLSGISLIE